MRILGIETSCDDTAAAVLEAKGGFAKPSFSVLSNVLYSQTAIHKKFGGIVPNLASRAHLAKIEPTVKEALRAAKTAPEKIDLIAATRGPGLMPSLLIGVNFARALSYKWQKPIIGINHIEGHIFSNWLSPAGKFSISDFRFPVLVLVASGGHTELVLMKNYGKYEVVGRTLDDAAGECFDKTARILKLGFPGGPAIAEAAKKSKIEDLKSEISLPRPMMNSKNFDFSFSGLKTAVLYMREDLIKKYAAEKIVPAMAAEIQESIVEVLVFKTIKAAEKFRPKTLMIAGGVSANAKLREKMAAAAALAGIPLSIPGRAYSTDNAAMIAAAGYFDYLKKKPAGDSWKKIEADANLGL